MRELENTIERMVVLSDGELITPEDLPLHIRTEVSRPVQDFSEYSLIREIEEALKKTNYNQASAARILGITARQYKIKKYGIRLSP